MEDEPDKIVYIDDFLARKEEQENPRIPELEAAINSLYDYPFTDEELEANRQRFLARIREEQKIEDQGIDLLDSL